MKIRSMATEVVDDSMLWATKPVLVRGGELKVPGSVWCNSAHVQRYMEMPTATTEIAHLVSGWKQPAAHPLLYAQGSLDVMDKKPVWWRSVHPSWRDHPNATSRTDHSTWAGRCASYCARVSSNSMELAFLEVDLTYGRGANGCRCFTFNSSVVIPTDADAMEWLKPAVRSSRVECETVTERLLSDAISLCTSSGTCAANLPNQKTGYCLPSSSEVLAYELHTGPSDPHYLPRASTASGKNVCTEQDCENWCRMEYGDDCKGWAMVSDASTEYHHNFSAHHPVAKCFIYSCDCSEEAASGATNRTQVSVAGAFHRVSKRCALRSTPPDATDATVHTYVVRTEPFPTSTFIEPMQGTLLYQRVLQLGMEIPLERLKSAFGASGFSDERGASTLEECFGKCAGKFGHRARSVRWNQNADATSVDRCVCFDGEMDFDFDNYTEYTGSTHVQFYQIQWCAGVKYPSDRTFTWSRANDHWCPGTPALGGQILSSSSTAYSIQEDAGKPTDVACRERCERDDECAYAQSYVQTWDSLQVVRQKPPPPSPPFPPSPPPLPQPPLPPLPPLSPPTDVDSVRYWSPRGSEVPQTDEDGRFALVCGLKETRSFNATVYAGTTQLDALDQTREMEARGQLDASLCPWECAPFYSNRRLLRQAGGGAGWEEGPAVTYVPIQNVAQVSPRCTSTRFRGRRRRG